MSLVSTYVQSKQGNWYENPTVEGDGWFICWDDDEPIELVIADDAKTVNGQPLTAQTVLNKLKKEGWSLRILYSGSKAQRLFKGNFKPAKAYFLSQYSGPTDRMLKGKRLKMKPTGQGVYYTNSINGNGGQA